MDSLEGIARQVGHCTDCPLWQGRTNAVPGEGPAKADLMFIGEGPGYHEDRQGRPFVGPAGQFLDELLTSVGLARHQVFIANMVKCRPPLNRDPLPSEVEACRKYLDRQIQLVDPKVIITLGRFSLARFFPGESISRARGRAREKDGRTIYPIMHPAAALHREANRAGIVADFQAIPSILERARRAPTAAATPTGPEESPPPEQLSLF